MTRNWLEEAMAYQGISISEIAKQLDLRDEYVSAIISGKTREQVPLSCLSEFGRCLNIALDDVIALEQEYCAYREKMKAHSYMNGKLDDRFTYEVCKLNLKEGVFETVAKENTLEAIYLRYFEILKEEEKMRFSTGRDSVENSPYPGWNTFREYMAEAGYSQAKSFLLRGDRVFLGEPSLFPDRVLTRIKIMRIK